MNVALLNERITFQKNETLIDKYGNHKNEWTDYYSCAATIGGEGNKSSGEQAIAGVIVENADVSFTVRFCKKVDALTTDGYRIVFRGELYDILSVDHMGYRRKCVKFRCKKTRR